MENLKYFYKEFTENNNCFALQTLCKYYKVKILSMDTNHISCIVKYRGSKWYLTTDKIERA